MPSAACSRTNAARCCAASSRSGATRASTGRLGGNPISRWRRRAVRYRLRATVGGYPFENVEIGADVVDVAHRLPAARVAMLRLRVPELLGEQGQKRAHVLPRIRVAAVHLREDAGVFEMAITHVVG